MVFHLLSNYRVFYFPKDNWLLHIRNDLFWNNNACKQSYFELHSVMCNTFVSVFSNLWLSLEIALGWEAVAKLFIYMAKPQSSMIKQNKYFMENGLCSLCISRNNVCVNVIWLLAEAVRQTNLCSFTVIRKGSSRNFVSNYKLIQI